MFPQTQPSARETKSINTIAARKGISKKRAKFIQARAINMSKARTSKIKSVPDLAIK